MYCHYFYKCTQINSCLLIASDSIEQVVEKYGLQRVSMLRAFCMSVGIQILLREYNLDIKNKQIFNEEDIVNIFPVAKHIHPKVRFIFVVCSYKVWDLLIEEIVGKTRLNKC